MAADLSLDTLRTFVFVYRARSITAAARELGLSQSTVTAHVASLERELDSVLFTRGPRGVVPTARADTFAAEAASSVDELERILYSLKPAPHTEDRIVQLAGPAEFISSQVLPGLAFAELSGVALRVRYGVADQLLGELAAGVHDLIISSVPVHAAGIEASPLYTEEFVLVAAPGSNHRELLAERMSRASGADGLLDGISVVAYAEHLPLVRRYFRSRFGRGELRGHLDVVVPDLRDVAAIVAQGLGVSVLPRYLIAEHLRRGELVVVNEQASPPTNTIYVAKRKRAGRNDAAIETVERLIRHAVPVE